MTMRYRNPRSLHSSQNRRRGGAILEMAVGLPVLVGLASGVFAYGYSFFVYHELQQAVRGGARYAAVADYDGPSGVNYLEQIKNVTVYGRAEPGAQDVPLAPGLTTAHVDVTVDVDASGLPMRVRVGIVNYSVDAVWQVTSFHNKPRSAFPYQGQLS